MCDECARLQAVYGETAERLITAQRELARYGVAKHAEAFMRLWKECETELKVLWSLRQEMSSHSATHANGTC